MGTAAAWALVAASALFVGALVSVLVRVPHRLIGAIMGFGAGVLFSAVVVELTREALDHSGPVIVTVGLLVGALTYSAGDWALAAAGAHRRQSPLGVGSHASVAGSALVVGALLDGIPESAAIGISLLGGGDVSAAFIVAVFLSNIPEGMAATAGMLSAGRRRSRILAMWVGVALACALAAGIGYGLLGTAGPGTLGGIQAFASGAVLSMLATTMLPEAVDHGGRLVGLVTVLGFICAVLLGEL